MSYSQIGVRIRELRENQHYSRESFAEKVNLSSKFLYEIETGKKKFSAETLSRIAKGLSVSCDYIMFGDESEMYQAERIVSILGILDSKKTIRIQDLSRILFEICSTL